MGFLVYDLIFLVGFTLVVSLVLWKRKENLKREGIIFLYRTKFGMRTIDCIGKKYKQFLNSAKYVVIFIGTVLMIIVTYLIGNSVYSYIKIPEIAKVIKAPPIAPLIPYFPRLFGMKSYFPDFYFTYFIIALGIVAVFHEFFHGIFMRAFNIKIKSTGFVFLGPLFGAFVEQDEKQMNLKSNSEQMGVLAAGTFANLMLSIIFFLILIGFFYACFSPAGYIFNGYAMKGVKNISANEIVGTELLSANIIQNITKVYTENETYYIQTEVFNERQIIENGMLSVYEGSPAVKSELDGIIVEADGKRIRNQEDLSEILGMKKPEDNIVIKTKSGEKFEFYSFKLDAHPLNDSVAFMGIGFYKGNPTNILGKFIAKIMSFKESSTFYEPIIDGDLIWFVYYLIWWIALINALVALFNMLPVGFLDGGKFFYLGVLSVTKSEKAAKNAFKAVMFVILTGFILMTVAWLLRVF